MTKCIFAVGAVCAAVLAIGEPSVYVSNVGIADTRNIRSPRAEVVSDTRLPVAGRSVAGSVDSTPLGAVIIVR